MAGNLVVGQFEATERASQSVWTLHESVGLLEQQPKGAVL